MRIGKDCLFFLYTQTELSEAQLHLICFRFLSTRVSIEEKCVQNATASLSPLALDPIHINTNSAHLSHRHSNEILCASMLCCLSQFFSLSLFPLPLFLLFPLTVTLTAKQVLLTISCARILIRCLRFYLLDRSHHIIQ